MWGISSAGRAVALQAIGQRFDPVILHQIYGAIVYRLGHQVFILRSGVRFPVALPILEM
jgi:hypothetical protein